MKQAPVWLGGPVGWAGAVWSRPWLGFVAVFAGALWQRWHMPWLPLATADSWGFLGPALYELGGEGFRQTHGRSIAYPLFLLGVLRATESFSAIAVVQHAIGLLSGVVWIWVFAQWVAWLPALLQRRPWVWWLGACALGLYWLGAWAVVYETMLRPESIFPFFAFLQIGCTLALLRARWHSPGWVRIVAAGASAVLCAALCASLKPSWGFAAAVPVVALLAGIASTGEPARRLASVLALVCGLALAALWQKGVPSAAGWIGDDQAKTFLPATLFTVHANLIAKTMHEQADRGLLDDEETVFLAHLDRRLAESRAIPKYKALGHDPDYLMYHSDTLVDLPGDAGATADGRAAYFRSAYFEAWRAQPAGMLAKVGRQVLLAHSNTRTSLHSSSAPWRVHFESASGFPAVYRPPFLSLQLSAGWEELFRKCTALATTEPARRKFVPTLPTWFHGVFLGALVGFLTVAGVMVLPARRGLFHARADLLPAARVFAVIVLTHLGMVFTVAVVHSFDIGRYMALLSPSQSLLLGTGSVLLVAFLSSTWRPPQNPAR
jgi:hypothetical protein